MNHLYILKKFVFKIDGNFPILTCVCLVLNCFINFTDDREQLLQSAINCKIPDAVHKPLESLPEIRLPVFKAPLPEND